MNSSKLAEAAAKAGIGLATAGPAGAALAVAPQAAGGVVEWLFGRPELVGHDEAWRDQLRHEVRVFYEEREERFRAEVQVHLRRVRCLIAEIEARMTDAERAVAAYPTIEEVAVLVQQYAAEARRSVLEERVELMAAALAANFRPDTTSEMRSRVERALAQLEPADVVELRTLATQRHKLRDANWSVHVVALLQAGCLLYDPQTSRWFDELLAQMNNALRDARPLYSHDVRYGELAVTDVGHAVIRFVETWSAPIARSPRS